jgi:hypothetical protein
MKENDNTSGVGAGFGSFAIKQILPLVLAAVAVMAALWIAIQYFGAYEQERNTQHESTVSQDAGTHAASPEDTPHAMEDTHATEPVHELETASTEETHREAVETNTHTAEILQESEAPHMAAPTSADDKGHASANGSETSHTQPSKAAAAGNGSVGDTGGHAAAGHGEVPQKTYPVSGMAFVDAVIQPMDYELNHRSFGWRPNDIVEYTDNVNNFQLGVLEVTRRTSRILAERLSRTGSSSSFDPNLETAMNWFMIKADRYWFPSAESKYRDGLKELREYYHNLERGEAQFFTRTDNLIPLLSAYQDLLGSCDENLVKKHEPDGSPVSLFKADDYFYYSKGVASALHTILGAIEIDFHIMVSREGGLEVLHHAIDMCNQATEIEPWIVLNSGYSSILANHRANMAAPISHARYYIGVLIKALST